MLRIIEAIEAKLEEQENTIAIQRYEICDLKNKIEELEKGVTK